MTATDADRHHPEVTDLMDSARHHGRVLRCITAWGTVIDYASIHETIPDAWVRITQDKDGLGPGRIVGPDAVRNDARACEPDVQTVSEDNSLFSEADVWE